VVPYFATHHTKNAMFAGSCHVEFGHRSPKRGHPTYYLPPHSMKQAFFGTNPRAVRGNCVRGCDTAKLHPSVQEPCPRREAALLSWL
jgi:hypothetical protein